MYLECWKQEDAVVFVFVCGWHSSEAKGIRLGELHVTRNCWADVKGKVARVAGTFADSVTTAMAEVRLLLVHHVPSSASSSCVLFISAPHSRASFVPGCVTMCCAGIRCGSGGRHLAGAAGSGSPAAGRQCAFIRAHVIILVRLCVLLQESDAAVEAATLQVLQQVAFFCRAAGSLSFIFLNCLQLCVPCRSLIRQWRPPPRRCCSRWRP